MKRCVSLPHGVSKSDGDDLWHAAYIPCQHTNRGQDGWRHTSTSCILPVCLGNRFHIFHHLMVRVLVASSSNRCFLKLWQDWGRLTGMMPAGPEGWWPRHPNQPNRHSLLFQMLAEARPRLPWQLRDAKSTVNGCGGLPHGFLGSLNHSLMSRCTHRVSIQKSWGALAATSKTGSPWQQPAGYPPFPDPFRIDLLGVFSRFFFNIILGISHFLVILVNNINWRARILPSDQP